MRTECTQELHQRGERARRVVLTSRLRVDSVFQPRFQPVG